MKKSDENEGLQKQIDVLRQEINQNSDLNLVISNQQMNISHLNEELQQTRNILTNIEQILPSNSSENLLERVQQLIDNTKQKYSDDEINELKLSVTKLQGTYDESSNNSALLEKQRQEYTDEIQKIRK